MSYSLNSSKYQDALYRGLYRSVLESSIFRGYQGGILGD